MQTAGIGTTTVSNTTTGQSKSLNMVSKDDFLKILISQIKYQDPLEPLKPDQFLSQLSQLTQVEQLQNITSALEAMQKSAEKGSMSQWVTAIGKKMNVEGNVMSPGDEVYLAPQGDYDEVILTVQDVGTGNAREVRIARGEPLIYRHEGENGVQVGVTAVKGSKVVTCRTSLYRIVKGIDVSDGGPFMIAADGTKYATSSILQIKE